MAHWRPWRRIGVGGDAGLCLEVRRLTRRGVPRADSMAAAAKLNRMGNVRSIQDQDGVFFPKGS